MLRLRILDCLPLLIGLTLLFGYCGLTCADDGNPHLLSKDQSPVNCQRCHITKPALTCEGIFESHDVIFIPAHFRLNAIDMCLSCHKPHHLHAEVSKKIDFNVPADMPLGENHNIVCLTCHYMHGCLDSRQPCANIGFMDRWFDTERMHKSYLLRRDNRDGGLCLTCHSPSGEQ